MDDPKKEWQDGAYVKKKSVVQKPPKRKPHNDWFLRKKKPGDTRMKCLDRFCETLVNPNINPYCRKCRRKKAVKFGRAEFRKRRAEAAENVEK